MKDFEDFTSEECSKVWESVLANKRHSNPMKTAKFILEIKNIEPENIEQVLSAAEEYFCYTSEFFRSSEECKMIFAAKKIKEIKNSDLECCLQLYSPDSTTELITHALSLEHYLNSNNINLSLHKDIEFIVDYFKATKNVNIKELILLYQLVKRNTKFEKILRKY